MSFMSLQTINSFLKKKINELKTAFHYSLYFNYKGDDFYTGLTPVTSKTVIGVAKGQGSLSG